MEPSGNQKAEDYMKRAGTLVRKLWKETGEIVPQGKDPVGAIIQHGNKYNSTRFTLHLQNYIVLYDQFATWLTELATLLIFQPRQNGETSRPAYGFLTAAICSLALSIRHQVVIGHDLAAKILVRSLYEYVDVLMLLIARPELVAEYEELDFEKANEFWHRHVKSSKARRALWASVAPGIPVPIDWNDWRKQEDTILSIAAHPSYTRSP
jgi:hypothetical protein